MSLGTQAGIPISKHPLDMAMTKLNINTTITEGVD